MPRSLFFTVAGLISSAVLLGAAFSADAQRPCGSFDQIRTSAGDRVILISEDDRAMLDAILSMDESYSLELLNAKDAVRPSAAIRDAQTRTRESLWDTEASMARKYGARVDLRYGHCENAWGYCYARDPKADRFSFDGRFLIIHPAGSLAGKYRDAQ